MQEKNFYRGNTEVEYISHGEWGDPELVYKGLSFNYWDVDEGLGLDFEAEYPDIDINKTKNTIDGREGPEEVDTEALFNEFAKIRVCDLLDNYIYSELEGEWSGFGKDLSREEVYKAWEEFSDGCVDEEDCIDRAFYRYPIGTFREDIWHDFESLFGVDIPESINSGKLYFHEEKYVTVDLEQLYNQLAPDNTKCGVLKLSFGSIEATGNGDGTSKPYYFDFSDNKNINICMTDETCCVISAGPDFVLLRNFNGNTGPCDMKLSPEEFNIACNFDPQFKSKYIKETDNWNQSKLERLLTHFGDVYESLYKTEINNPSLVSYRTEVEEGDMLLSSEKGFIEKFNELREDFLVSDRELAAFVIALRTLDTEYEHDINGYFSSDMRTVDPLYDHNIICLYGSLNNCDKQVEDRVGEIKEQLDECESINKSEKSEKGER